MFFKNSGPIYRDMLRHYNGWSPSGPQVVQFKKDGAAACG